MNSTETMGCLSGLRVISTQWIVIGHTFFAYYSLPIRNKSVILTVRVVNLYPLMNATFELTCDLAFLKFLDFITTKEYVHFFCGDGSRYVLPDKWHVSGNQCYETSEKNVNLNKNTP